MSVEIITTLMPTLTPAELCDVMKVGADLMAKAVKGSVPKAARAKGVCPPQLVQNKVWVEAVFAFAAEHGWEAFEAKDGDSIIQMEASVPTEAGPRFSDNSELNMKQAMSLAKHLRDSNSEFWVAFSESYAEDHPAEEKPASAAVTPVRRTRLEISIAAAEKKRIAEEEKAAKALQRAEEKRVRDEAKAAETKAKEEAKAAKAALAAAAKLEKESAKTAKLPSASSAAAATRVAALIAKIKPAAPAAAAAAPAEAAATSPRAPVVAAVAAPAKKIVAKSMSQKWVAPADGEWDNFPYKGKVYMANNKYHVFAKGTEDGELGDWVGQYIPAEDRIDDTVDEPAVDDEEDED